MKKNFFIFFVCCFCFLSRTDAQTKSTITKINIKDAIHVGTYEYIKRAHQFSVAQKHAGLLIELDTPGGYLEATRDIVQLMLNSDHPIAVWVTPTGARAASAGAMITMAAHVAIMAPSTSIGAATPVTQEGDVAKDMKQKVMNDTISFVEGIATKRNRNAQWAKDSVTSAASLSAQEAINKKVIDQVINDEKTLMEYLSKVWKLKSSDTSFLLKPMQFREKMISFFANPNIAYALMGLGALGIYVEMTNPGLIFPGAIGAISLALGAMTTKIIPINTGALGLLALALIFFAIEIFVPAATFGIAGIAGIVSLFLSGTLLLDPEQTNLRLDASFWLPIFFVVSAAVAWFMIVSIKSIKQKPYKQGVDGLEGKPGVVKKILSNNEYKVVINGELWNAMSHEPLNLNDHIVVTKQNGFELNIKKENSHV